MIYTLIWFRHGKRHEVSASDRGTLESIREAYVRAYGMFAGSLWQGATKIL